MLSNKLTFSLVFVLMLALVAGPAMAQRVVLSQDLSPAAGIAKEDFVVYVMNGTPPNGIVTITPVAASSSTNGFNNTDDGAFPDLESLFDFRGTVELISTKEGAKLAITEIMWGTDAGATTTDGTAIDGATVQWIEFYNYGDALVEADDVRIKFTENQRIQMDEWTDVNGSGVDGEGGNTETDDVDYFVHDRVSTSNQFGIVWDPPGQSGRSSVGDNGEPVVNVISMYRTIDLDGAKYKTEGTGEKLTLKGLGDGTEKGDWAASSGRINISGAFIGSPGAVHQNTGGIAAQTKDPASLPVGSVIINEIYNGGNAATDLRWIELYNTGDADVLVKNYEMDAVAGAGKPSQVFWLGNDNDNVKVPAKGFLLVTNKDPDDSILAGGVDVKNIGGDNVFGKGATHRYIVRDVDFPNAPFLLVLRSERMDNHEKVVDIAGNYFHEVGNVTKVHPLKGWTVPGDRGDETQRDKRWGKNSLEINTGRTYARKEQKSRANRLHKDDWEENVGFRGGLGYDPGADSALAVGTPGYANNAVKGKVADITGSVVISEIMYDAGADNRLVQWIELYNSSMTESVNLNNWKLEVRNIDSDVDSYVDAIVSLKAHHILPNQTALLVSDRSSASDVEPNRVYNLYQNHRSDLGLSTRRSVLFSREGFYLKLTDADNKVADTAGNVMVDGPRRTVEWKLPETGGEMRQSIIRQFGTRTWDGTADMADDGTMMSSWIPADFATSYYGHRDDMSSAGNREGGPVPVSLSSFRPVRDDTTGHVVVRWVTQSELNNAGFNILRSETKT
ncbi:MAG: lamin tail domain-containing protein, partial [Candidatus Poribacteria bacterium]|nr:lamin tail domain-containing protein [Candidatus Poribacteria bacterium]